MSTKSMIFDHYPAPNPKENATFLYTNDPVIQLDPIEPGEGRQFPRHAAQSDVLKRKQIQIADDDLVLGSALEWACRGYIVQRLSQERVGNRTIASQFDTVPAQAVNATQRREETEGISVQPKRLRSIGDGSEPQCEVSLYLFNVLVALEWIPDKQYMQQLAWAFRHASDFLYDVTDGCMAFGQVVFGGPELMDGADIQIMASNRLYPRSWVNGLLDETKYRPIRLGRGIWHRRNQVTIPWDEPEAYRTLIHEWAHYALGLRDEYLEVVNGLVVPATRIPSTSIMASLEGTSELVPHARNKRQARKAEEWSRIDQLYPGLQRSDRTLEGPGRLPLPLPYMRYTVEMKHALEHRASQDAPSLQNTFPNDIQYDYCWVYVLRRLDPDTKKDTSGIYPEGFGLIAQGTLDARTYDDGFVLLGAAEDDTVLLISDPPDKQPTMFRGVIKDGTVRAWTSVISDSPALIDVVPYLADGQGALQIRSKEHQNESQPRTGYISVRIKAQRGLPKQVWLFPLGQTEQAKAIQLKQINSATASTLGIRQGEWFSELEPVSSLDGHVVALWDDHLAISPFSQGGGPPTHDTVNANPISAGSSDGNILVFFRDQNWRDPLDHLGDPSHRKTRNKDYSHVRVTTTLSYDEAPEAARGRLHSSYTYGLASTNPLPTDLKPTMVVFYDPLGIQAADEPYVEHLNDDGKWEPLQTQPAPGNSFVAVALTEQTARRLVADAVQEPRVERYRLAWTPRDGSKVTVQQKAAQ